MELRNSGTHGENPVRAKSARTREAGRCQPRKATAGSASSAGCTGACWGKSAQMGARKPAATSTSVASSRERVFKTRAKPCRKGASRTDRTVNASAHGPRRAESSWRVQRHYARQSRHDARQVVQHQRNRSGKGGKSLPSSITCPIKTLTDPSPSPPISPLYVTSYNTSEIGRE